MLEKNVEQKKSPIPTGNSVLDTMFGQALANQGMISQ